MPKKSERSQGTVTDFGKDNNGKDTMIVTLNGGSVATLPCKAGAYCKGVASGPNKNDPLEIAVEW